MKKDEKIFTRLIAYLRGDPDAAQRVETERLLKNSPELREKLSLLKKLLATVADTNSGEFGNYVRELSSRLFEDFSRSKKGSKTSRGVKIFDSRMIPLPEGVRPAAVDTRRVKFRAGDIRLELAFYPVTPDSYEIIGQLDGVKLSGVYEVVFAGDDRVFAATTDKFFLFRFPRIPVMKYQLRLKDENGAAASFVIEL